ncbi:hypothetical protein IQ26_07604 [Mesorhizobium tianshanense]|uniref:Uncharacterized protein n=1 Tax=Mesorhizobium tianshanense TaxID=39844 RepID=A0A562MAY6_9HYPH|nr:hypothetical protein IQ26_07604 [Mesorhizobium tianshanense]
MAHSGGRQCQFTLQGSVGDKKRLYCFSGPTTGRDGFVGRKLPVGGRIKLLLLRPIDLVAHGYHPNTTGVSS